MTWHHVSDCLPPLETPVIVCGRATPLDANGIPTHGLPIARRRHYPGIPPFWSSDQWRGTVGIEWWHELPDDLPRRYSA